MCGNSPVIAKTIDGKTAAAWHQRLGNYRCNRPISLGVIVAVGLALLGWLPGRGWAGEDWAWKVVQRSVQAEGTVAYEGMRDIVIFRDGKKVAGYQQKVQQAPGNRERITVLYPPQQQGRVEVCDGHQRWEYYPTTQRLIISRVPPVPALHQRQLAALRATQQHLQAEYQGEEKVAGRTAYKIWITGSDGRPLRRLWIDKHTFVKLKIHRFDPRGQLIYSAYFTKIDYHPNFSADLFTFRPPPKARTQHVPPPLNRVRLEIAEKQAGFRAIVPGYVPSGYRLERDAVAVSRHDGHFMLWLPFSNGLDTFSLFQAPRRLRPPQPCQAGHVWTQGKYCFALIGPLSEEEIVKIKASMGR